MKKDKGAPPNPICLMLTDKNLSEAHRIAMLREFLGDDNPETIVVLRWVLKNLSHNSTEAVAEKKLTELNALLKELKEGPLRSAAFIQLSPEFSNGVRRALVMLDDGTQAYTVVPDEQLASELKLGDPVVLSGQGNALLHRGPNWLRIGEVANLERVIDSRHVEVSLRNGAERAIFMVPQTMADDLAEEQLAPGASLIVNPRQSLVLAAVPDQDGYSHFRFLDRGSVPDVDVKRDIGSPPRAIAEVLDHVWMELNEPEIRRRYGLPRCMTKLFCGGSGTGKTLSINAIQSGIYQLTSDYTGVPVDQLPKRVFRIRQGQVLSMWYGESEKNWERAIDEAQQLAAEEFETPDGRKVRLPVLVVLEEIDGLGASRDGHDAVNNRVLTTVLQRLDPNRQDIKDNLIIVLATTNEPHLVDVALLRRLGGTIENFKRLNRRSFPVVFQKLTQARPPAALNGYSREEIWRRFSRDLTDYYFSENSPAPGLVEITYAGSTNPVIKHRRDFLTGALVDRAVQQAASEAAKAEKAGDGEGITFEQLVRAFEGQLRGLVAQLRESNVGRFTDLPDGVRVASLRRLPQPKHLPFELLRNQDHE